MRNLHLYVILSEGLNIYHCHHKSCSLMKIGHISSKFICSGEQTGIYITQGIEKLNMFFIKKWTPKQKKTTHKKPKIDKLYFENMKLQGWRCTPSRRILFLQHAGELCSTALIEEKSRTNIHTPRYKSHLRLFYTVQTRPNLQWHILKHFGPTPKAKLPVWYSSWTILQTYHCLAPD